MAGGTLRQRFALRPPRVVGRAWPDCSRDVQEFLDSTSEEAQGIPAGLLGLTPLDVLVGGTPAPGAVTDGWMGAGAQLVTAAPTTVTGVGIASSLGSSTSPSREDHQHRFSILVGQGETLGFDGVNPVALPAPTFFIVHVLMGPAAPIDVTIWRAPWAATLTALHAYQVGGTTVNVNARLNGASEHLAADMAVAAGAWVTAGALQNTAYVAGDSLEVRLKAALVGVPVQVAFQLEFTRP